MSDALGRYSGSLPPVRRWPSREVLILELPYEAWRLLGRFLQCEPSFCYYITPGFNQRGRITLLLTNATTQPEGSEQPGH